MLFMLDDNNISTFPVEDIELSRCINLHDNIALGIKDARLVATDKTLFEIKKFIETHKHSRYSTLSFVSSLNTKNNPVLVILWLSVDNNAVGFAVKLNDEFHIMQALRYQELASLTQKYSKAWEYYKKSCAAIKEEVKIDFHHYRLTVPLTQVDEMIEGYKL